MRHGSKGDLMSSPADESPQARRPPGMLEDELLAVLWATGRSMTPADVQIHLGHRLAYTTVMTVLTILCRKDLARRHRNGRAWLYAPTLSRDDYLTQRVRDLVALARDPETVMRNALTEPQCQSA